VRFSLSWLPAAKLCIKNPAPHGGARSNRQIIVYWVARSFLPSLETPHKGAVITVAVIGGEALWVLAATLLGKEYWGQVRHGFKLAWTRTIQRNRPVPDEENNMSIRRALAEDFPALLQIWEQSVRATHDLEQARSGRQSGLSAVATG
jgi:hypothetical protein